MSKPSLQEQLDAVIDAWNAEFTGKAITSFRQAAEFTTEVLRRTSPKMTGDYAAGWTWAEKSSLGRGSKKVGAWQRNGYIVYNATEWQLTHLLEKGHENPTAGPGKQKRTPAYPHIKDAEQDGIADLVRRLYENL